MVSMVEDERRRRRREGGEEDDMDDRVDEEGMSGGKSISMS